MRSALRHLPEPIKAPLRQFRDVAKWYLNGQPLPPPGIIKRRLLKQLQNNAGLNVFVETGTFMGDTVHAMTSHFKSIHSIELSPDLYKRAQQRFQNASSVSLYQGDSGIVLKDVLNNISEPALFWLDGHYSEGITAKADLNTPIIKEIDLIAAHAYAKDHVIVIDDAREFTGKNDYPTETVLRDYLHQKGFVYFKQVSDMFIASAKPL